MLAGIAEEPANLDKTTALHIELSLQKATGSHGWYSLNTDGMGARHGERSRANLLNARKKNQVLVRG